MGEETDSLEAVNGNETPDSSDAGCCECDDGGGHSPRSRTISSGSSEADHENLGALWD